VRENLNSARKKPQKREGKNPRESGFSAKSEEFGRDRRK
jgi:hypothetical protein